MVRRQCFNHKEHQERGEHKGFIVFGGWEYSAACRHRETMEVAGLGFADGGAVGGALGCACFGLCCY